MAAGYQEDALQRAIRVFRLFELGEDHPAFQNLHLGFDQVRAFLQTQYESVFGDKFSEGVSVPGLLLSFRQIVKKYDLNSAPTDFASAALRYTFLEPLPSEVWAYLPSRLYWQPALGEIGIDLDEWLRRPLPELPPDYGDSTLAAELETYFPPTSGRAGGKVNLTLGDLFSRRGIISPLARRFITLARGVEVHESWESVAFISLLLLDQMSATTKLATELYLRLPNLFSMELKQYQKIAKVLHTGARMTHTLPNVPFRVGSEFARSTYGLDSVGGRSEFIPMDQIGEIRMRLRDPTKRAIPILLPGGGRGWSSEQQYDAALDRCIEETIESALVDEVTPVPFTQWYAQRMFWAASGGAPGATVTWGSETGKERMSKRGALLIIPEAHVRAILETTLGPVLYSKYAKKFENLKTRAIWNTSVEEYVIEAYILDMFDKHQRGDGWNSAAHSLRSKVVADLARLQALENNVGFMWDYSDFNINHTFKAMRSLYTQAVTSLSRRIRSTITAASSPKARSDANESLQDLAACQEWFCSARFQTYLEDNESGMIARIARSLQSGQRGTSFTNTMLNRAYTLMVRKWCLSFLGYNPMLADSYHQGDDVYALTASVVDGMILSHVYNLLGYAGQKYKITCDYHGSAEFLRLGYNWRTRTIGGYPVRSAMGLIGGEFFRESTGDPAERIAAFYDQYLKVQRRGGCITPALLDLLVKRKCGINYTPPGRTKSIRVVPPVELALAPAALGGYGLSATLTSGHRVDTLPVAPSNTTPNGSPIVLPHLQMLPRSAATFIPSGEGKTVLANAYPHLFIDHDALIDPVRNRFKHLHHRAVEFNAWAELNRFLAGLVKQARKRGEHRVLLTWGPSSAWHGDSFLGGFLLANSTGIRANIANRSSIIASGARFFPDFGTRDAALHASVVDYVETAYYRLLAVDSARAFSTHTFQHFSGPPRPQLAAPANPREAFFSRAAKKRFSGATDIMDMKTAGLLGAEKAVPRIQDRILESVLSGAYAAPAVSAALSSFAEQLDRYLKGTKPAGRRSLVPLPAAVHRHCFLHSLEFWQAVVADANHTNPSSAFNRSIPNETEALPTLNNSNGLFSSVTIPAGFSATSSLEAVVAELSPLHYFGELGRWNRLFSLTPSLSQTGHSAPSTLLRLVRLVPFTPQSHAHLAAYLSGARTYLPPAYTGLGSTYTSATRALVLSFIERHYPTTLVRDEWALLSAVYQLELSALLSYHTACVNFKFGLITYAD